MIENPPFSTNSLFSSLQGGGYQLKQYSYPENVGGEGLGHFIMFVINETDSKSNESPSSIRPITNSSVPDFFGATTPRREDATATGVKSRRLTGTVGKTRRASEIISLYMPENITSVYGLDYENTNMQAASTVGSGSLIDQTSHIYNGNFDKINLSSTELYQSLSNTTDQTARDAGRVGLSNMNQAVADALSAKFREAYNPHMEFLFRGVQLRTFQFDFIFTPKSEQEAINVYNIIKLFKVNAMPEVRESAHVGVFYKYPSEFDILFISNGQENTFLHKISTCALTNIAVNYTGAGMTSMHKSMQFPDGAGAAPTHTILSLQFTEMEIMSKQRMEEGF